MRRLITALLALALFLLTITGMKKRRCPGPAEHKHQPALAAGAGG